MLRRHLPHHLAPPGPPLLWRSFLPLLNVTVKLALTLMPPVQRALAALLAALVRISTWLLLAFDCTASSALITPAQTVHRPSVAHVENPGFPGTHHPKYFPTSSAEEPAPLSHPRKAPVHHPSHRGLALLPLLSHATLRRTLLQQPPSKLTQSSADEIDAFAERTICLSDAPAHDATSSDNPPSTKAPSPSSNMPSGPTPAPVFTRPATAVPSRAPSRAVSVASVVSTGDAGIAGLLEPTFFPPPLSPPPLSDVVGLIHRRFPMATLKVDDEDSRHFLARDDTRVDSIADSIDHLLTSNSSWPSLLYFIRDVMKFECIKGPATDFQVFLTGLADIWSDAADFNARELLHHMNDAFRYFPKAEKEIDRLEAVSSWYRDERKAARLQLRTAEAELSRLRQAANDTLDSNARLLGEIDQLRATDAIAAFRERDEARAALNDAISISKASMAKQLSRYQQLSTIVEQREARIKVLEQEATEKDDYVLKTEREHAELYREREAAERQVSSLKAQLQDATSLFESTHEARRHDQEDHEERSSAFKKHISELNTRLNLLPSRESELRALVTNANEQAGIAEEEYRKKSTELKAALKELNMLKSKATKMDKATPATTAAAAVKSTTSTSNATTKSVRWGFEPSDNIPASKPFWDHSNEYSKYIASMVAATVTPIPSIPMQTAIATAIDTVHAAGLSILSQHTQPSKSKPTAPATSTNAKSPASTSPTSRPRSPATAAAASKGTKSAPISVDSAPASTATFAQMAASVLGPPQLPHLFTQRNHDLPGVQSRLTRVSS
ncbi:hypothetical protein AX14_001389 [Amanita brunnescens Koide BX004]|nr:hypothetical protein AX14_001389 [Amanita brunnescens Koide BX004]